MIGERNLNKETVHGSRLVVVIAALMVSLLLAALDSTIVSTAMKTIVNELDGMDLYAWPFTIYMLCSTVIIPISGGFADIFGRKPVFLLGIFLFLLGSAFCGLSPNMVWLIGFRGVQGLGGGIITTSVFTIVADLFPPRLRGKYMGIVTSMFGLSSILGPFVGGLITDYLSWRWIFFINVPLGMAAVALVLLVMPNFKSDGMRKKIDYPGALFIVLTIVPLLLAFSFAGTSLSWTSPGILLLLLGAAAMLCMFVLAETRSPNPIIPMSFFRDRAIWIGLLCAFVTNIVMYAAIIYIPYFIQGILGTSATASGAFTVPMTIAMMITSNVVGVCATKTSRRFRTLMLLAYAIAAAGAFLLSTMTSGTPFLQVAVYMVVFGAGLGITMPIINLNAQLAAPAEKLASVTGTTQFFGTIGGTVGSAVYGTILSASIAKGFLTLDLSGIPENVRSELVNPQVITAGDAIVRLVNSLPQEQAGAVNEAIQAAKNVLQSGIHNIFLFCLFAALSGILIAVFFKGAPIGAAAPEEPEKERVSKPS
jgi:EmrB/QacA subfamily drug resistance transporter